MCKRPPREARNVPFAKPKHPKAGRGKRSDPQGVTAGGCPRAAEKCRNAQKNTVGAAGLPPLAGEMSEGQRGHKAISTTYNPCPSMEPVHSRHHPRITTVIPAKAGIQRSCPRPVHAKPSQTSTLNLPFAKPKHPKARRGRAQQDRRGCPRRRTVTPQSPLPRWERVRVRVIPQRSPTSADQLPVKPYTVRKRRS